MSEFCCQCNRPKSEHTLMENSKDHLMCPTATEFKVRLKKPLEVNCVVQIIKPINTPGLGHLYGALGTLVSHHKETGACLVAIGVPWYNFHSSYLEAV